MCLLLKVLGDGTSGLVAGSRDSEEPFIVLSVSVINPS